MLLLSTALLLSACSNNKKAESTDATSNQETKISKTKETTETSSSTSKSTSKTDSSSTVTSSNQVTAEPSPTVISSSQSTIQTAPQEETYEQMKQRTLQSTPADRANWSNKEWEAFGVALYENGLTTDDAGNIISQDQKEQQAASQQIQKTNKQALSKTLTLYHLLILLTNTGCRLLHGKYRMECLRKKHCVQHSKRLPVKFN